MPEPTPPPADQFVDLRPATFRAKLIFWLTLSIGVHAAGGVALWLSDDLRTFLFQSFLGGKHRPPPSTDVTSMRYHFDVAARKSIIASNERMLAVTRTVDQMRQDALRAFEVRGAANPHMAAFATSAASVLRLDLLTDPGDFKRHDIAELFARACRFEAQVVRLYEQAKALGMSMVSVAGSADGQPVPQPIEVSLGLVSIELPPRPELDKPLLALSAAQIIERNRTMPVASASAGAKAEAGIADWLTLWRDEALKAQDLAQIMANNCDRILTSVEKSVLLADVASSKAPGMGSGEKYQDDAAYRGESLRAEDIASDDQSSADLKPLILLSKGIAKPENAFPAPYITIENWWEIGPFDYFDGVRSEESLRHVYPPETGVDLDATYIGKNKKPISWEYRTFTQLRMEPRYVTTRAIWYFYAELWSDEERQVWANFASDDYGAVWLNGKRDPVYTSGTDPRPFTVLGNRQRKRVTLQKGLNRILFKLDNRCGTTGFNTVFTLKGLK